MKQKIFSLLLALCLALGALASCSMPTTPQPPACTQHKDLNHDLKCDTCGAAVACEHADADKNLKCDVCGEAVACTDHEDDNADLKCDYCGAEVACVFHKDANKDQKCDICGTAVGKENTDFGTTDSDFSDILG